MFQRIKNYFKPLKIKVLVRGNEIFHDKGVEDGDVLIALVGGGRGPVTIELYK